MTFVVRQSEKHVKMRVSPRLPFSKLSNDPLRRVLFTGPAGFSLGDLRPLSLDSVNRAVAWLASARLVVAESTWTSRSAHSANALETTRTSF